MVISWCYHLTIGILQNNTEQRYIHQSTQFFIGIINYGWGNVGLLLRLLAI